MNPHQGPAMNPFQSLQHLETFTCILHIRKLNISSKNAELLG